MSLQIKFDLCVINNCTQLRFSENTGFYNISNKTGWGTPNQQLTDTISATLVITNPTGASYTIDLFATTLFPTDTYGLYYDIPLSSIGSPTTITDGKWKFVYTVIDSKANTATTTIYKYFYCNSACCVTEMLANIDLTCDCCKESDSYKDYELAWIQLESLKKAAACGDETNFEAIKKVVDKLCKNNGCKICN